MQFLIATPLNPFLLRLHKPQGHPVAFTNCGIFRAVGFTFGVVGGERPDAFGPSVGVFWIGVDLRFAGQFEACFGGKRHHRAFLHIAAFFFKRAVHAFGQTVFDNAEDTAGLEHSINLVERRLRGIRSAEAPVMNIAEGERDVGAGRSYWRSRILDREIGALDLAVKRRIAV